MLFKCLKIVANLSQCPDCIEEYPQDYLQVAESVAQEMLQIIDWWEYQRAGCTPHNPMLSSLFDHDGPPDDNYTPSSQSILDDYAYLLPYRFPPKPSVAFRFL